MEEEKKKSVASIPDNYVSILQLQERWLKEKERKQRKQKDSDSVLERGVKAKQQQVDHEQPRRQEEKAVKPEEKVLGGGSRMHYGVNRCNKEPKCVQKEELEVSATLVSNKDEDGGDPRDKKKSDPVKEDTRRVFTSKGEHAAKEETKFHKRWIKKRVEGEGETREVKGPARLTSGQGYYRNQRHDWSSTPTRAMVWVKKGNNHGVAGENGV